MAKIYSNKSREQERNVLVMSRELWCRLPSPSLSEHTGHAFSLAVNYWDMCGMFLPREALLSLRIRDFYLLKGISCYAASHGK